MSDKVLLSVSGFEHDAWLKQLQYLAPERTFVSDITSDTLDEIKYAIVWKQPKGLLDALPNLEVIFSAGAGVDHIIHDETLPNVPVVRIVADDLTNRMSEFIVWQALDHLRQGELYRSQQTEKIWAEDRMQVAASDVTVGIMGMGVLGQDAARKLSIMGFRVLGWSRTRKNIEYASMFSGIKELDAMLAQAEILICLLPLTPDTYGLINRALIDKLNSNGPLGGAVIINAGRGGTHIESDILNALNDGTLAAVSLDVFETEPLSQASALWAHPRATLTPHIAAASNPMALIPVIIAQMDHYERTGNLFNLVDKSRGY